MIEGKSLNLRSFGLIQSRRYGAKDKSIIT